MRKSEDMNTYDDRCKFCVTRKPHGKSKYCFFCATEMSKSDLTEEPEEASSFRLTSVYKVKREAA
jgi:hypothetical protein